MNNITNDNFLRACRRESTDHIPVWFMRQAGRYQTEYREIRKKHGFMEVVHTPELCAEVTLLPVQQMEVDAAILFSDIATPFAAFGVPFEIRENHGPHIANPVRNPAQIASLRNFDPAQELAYVGESIELLKKHLTIPLIGFCGAPFTLASYMVEGGGSKNYIHTKTLMFSQPKLWHQLMEKLVKMLTHYLTYQAESGADALQIFDSWVGNLSREDYEEFVFPHMQQLFDGLKPLSQPIIHFGVGTGHILDLMKKAGGDVIGLDWKMNVKQEWQRLGHDVAVQGNLDPGILLGPWERIAQRAKAILAQADRPGFIFNLGHGILPPTPPENLRRLVDLVHAHPVS
ncbi:MAG: uroporphyrinogen decarboxylase [Bacteroidia bacterium]